MSANCGTVIHVLYAFVDGELDSVQASAISVHLAECPRCEAEVVVARTVKTVIRRAHPPSPAPANVSAAIRRRLTEGQ